METKAEPPKAESLVEKRIRYLTEDLDVYTQHRLRLIEWLKKNAEAIETIGICPTASVLSSWDFDNPTREQILLIIKLFPGDWEKEKNEHYDRPRMNYTREKTDTEPRLRIWAGELPPSCVIVQEKVLVPEHYEFKNHVVCNGGVKEVEAAS